jgi:hypothetical protein
MAAENVMTPEERLLHAIQKGGAEAAAPAAPGAVATLGGDAEGVVRPAPSLAFGGFRPRTLARLCNLAASLLVAGAAYEIYANIPTAAVPSPPADPDFLASSTAAPPPRIDDTVDMYAKRRIFGKPGEVPIIDLDKEDNFAGWRAYIRDYFKIIGYSVVDRVGSDGNPLRVEEAIVVDSKKNLMHFLSTGQALVVEKESVAVESVSGEEIVFVSGETRMKFKK